MALGKLLELSEPVLPLQNKENRSTVFPWDFSPVLTTWWAPTRRSVTHFLLSAFSLPDLGQNSLFAMGPWTLPMPKSEQWTLTLFLVFPGNQLATAEPLTGKPDWSFLLACLDSPPKILFSSACLLPYERKPFFCLILRCLETLWSLSPSLYPESPFLPLTISLWTEVSPHRDLVCFSLDST